MNADVSRKELHTIIDAMPDHFIQAMMPLVTCIAEEYWKPVIEPASPEEIAMAEERIKDKVAVPMAGIGLVLFILHIINHQKTKKNVQAEVKHRAAAKEYFSMTSEQLDQRVTHGQLAGI